MWDNPALSDPRLEDPLGVPVCFPNGAMVGVVSVILGGVATADLRWWLYKVILAQVVGIYLWS